LKTFPWGPAYREFHQSRNDSAATYEIVLADFVQIAAGRSVTLVADPTNALSVAITVTGPASGYFNDGQDQGRTRTGSELFTHIEVDNGAAGTPLWIAGTEPGLSVTSTNGNSSTWSGTLDLPAARGSRPMRLVVREYETWPIDQLGRFSGPSDAQGSRLIFIDTIPL
jgi:hypothetical protein